MNTKKVASVQDSDMLSILTAQVASISRKLDNLRVGQSQGPMNNGEENIFNYMEGQGQ